MGKLIYIAEDEVNISEIITMSLVSDGYEVESFTTGDKLVKKAFDKKPDLILLDIMMPGMDGLAALSILRKDKSTENIPIIMVTAKSSELDKVAALDMGADDYITKPFGVLELVARVNAAIRTAKRYSSNDEVAISFKGINIDSSSRNVTANGQAVALTLKEFNLLFLLLERRGKVVSRDELLQKIWGYEFMGESRTLDMHIRALRLKLNDDKLIVTVRGVGYKIEES